MRKLTLKKETVAELGMTDLGSVVGASGRPCTTDLPTAARCSEVDACLSRACPTLDDGCLSVFVCS